MGHDEQAWNDEYVSVWTGPEKPETDYPENVEIVKDEDVKTEQSEQLEQPEQTGPRFKDGDRVKVLCTHNKRKRDAYYGQEGMVVSVSDQMTVWVGVPSVVDGEAKLEYFLESELGLVGKES